MSLATLGKWPMMFCYFVSDIGNPAVAGYVIGVIDRNAFFSRIKQSLIERMNSVLEIIKRTALVYMWLW